MIAGVGRIKAQFHDVNCDIDDVFCNARACADVFKAGQWASAPFLQDRSKSLQTFPALSFKGFCGIFDGMSALAIPYPAMSMAVPWSTGVRRFGKSTLTFTPLIDRHFPVDGSTLKASNLTEICPWSRNMAITASYCPARNSMNIVSHLATVRRSHGSLKQNTPQLHHACAGCNLKQCCLLYTSRRG